MPKPQIRDGVRDPHTCTACGEHAEKLANKDGTVGWAGVIAHICEGEPLCDTCFDRLINWQEA